MGVKMSAVITVAFIILSMVWNGSRPALAKAEISHVDESDFLYDQGNMIIGEFRWATFPCPFKPHQLALFSTPPMFTWYRKLTGENTTQLYHQWRMGAKYTPVAHLERIKLVGSLDNGDLGVRIRPLTVQDSGTYWCMVDGSGYPNTSLSIKSRPFQVVVRANTSTTSAFTTSSQSKTRLGATTSTTQPLDIFIHKSGSEPALSVESVGPTKDPEVLRSSSPATNLTTILVAAVSVGGAVVFFLLGWLLYLMRRNRAKISAYRPTITSSDRIR